MTEPLFYEYGGQISISRNQGRFVKYIVTFKHPENNRHQDVGFSLTKHKSAEDAYIAALEYRQVESDLRGLTIIHWPSELSMEEKSYFAGFFDGDGCCSVSKEGHVCLTVNQAQSHGIPDVLLKFQKAYGGNCYLLQQPKKLWRVQHSWQRKGFRALSLLHDLNHHSILKSHQTQAVYDSLISNGVPNCWEVYDAVKNAKRLEAYQSLLIDSSRINLWYCAGFFDAEGSIGTSNTIYGAGISISFAQKSSPNLLQALNNFFGNNGTLQSNYVIWSGIKAKTRICPGIIFICWNTCKLPNKRTVGENRLFTKSNQIAKETLTNKSKPHLKETMELD